MTPTTAAPPASAAPVQKQGLSIYTVLLIIAFLALTIGTVFLYLEMRKWGDGWRLWDTSGSQPAVSQLDRTLDGTEGWARWC